MYIYLRLCPRDYSRAIEQRHRHWQMKHMSHKSETHSCMAKKSHIGFIQTSTLGNQIFREHAQPHGTYSIEVPLQNAKEKIPVVLAEYDLTQNGTFNVRY